MQWLTLVAVPVLLGVGAYLGNFVAKRAAAISDTWATLRWADDKLSSKDPDEVSRAFDHIDNLLTSGRLTKDQRVFARVSLHSYQRPVRTSYLEQGSPSQVREVTPGVRDDQSDEGVSTTSVEVARGSAVVFTVTTQEREAARLLKRLNAADTLENDPATLAIAAARPPVQYVAE